jgi:muramoyltetrapeptide carboxypeptidase
MLKRLRGGCKIGVFTPSGSFPRKDHKVYKKAKCFFETQGFVIKEGSLTGKRDFYRSGSVRQRANELNQLLRDPEIECLIALTGGLNSNSLLPYIDYTLLKRFPKIIVGMSDITAILLAVYSRTGIVPFYGPNLNLYGYQSDFAEISFRNFSRILIDKNGTGCTIKEEDHRTSVFHNNKEKIKKVRWRSIQSGTCRGRLIGGNLDTIYGIWGSKYMPEIKGGDILFLEDVQKSASHMEKLFSLLKVNGVLDKISGVILGIHSNYDSQKSGRESYEILKEIMDRPEIPIVADVNCAHVNPMLTLPLGVRVELDATNKVITILEDWIC